MRLPILFVIQNRQAHRPRWINIRVRQNWLKHAFRRSMIGVWLPHWKVVRKVHSQIIGTFLPWSSFRPRNLATPFEHIRRPIFLVFYRFGNKAKRMVASPFFSFLFQPVDNKFVNFFFLHLKCCERFKIKYYCTFHGEYKISIRNCQNVGDVFLATYFFVF